MRATVQRNKRRAGTDAERLRGDGSSRLAARPGRRTSPAQPGRRKPIKAKGVDIRGQYRVTLQLSMVLSLLIVIGLFRMPMDTRSDDAAFTLVEQEVVQMEEVQQTEQVKRPPPPPRPPVPVVVPDDRVLDDVALDLDVSLDMDEIVALPPPPAPVAPEVEEEEAFEMEIFVVVEEMPQIVGGAQEVYKHLEYPEIARQAGVEGLSVIQIVVNPDGTPSDFQVARSAGEVLDNAAIAAVAKLQFVPGKQRGKAVRVRMAIPIRFRLKQVEKTTS